MTEEFKKQIETEARQAVTELLAQAKLKKGDVFVVGCSSRSARTRALRLHRLSTPASHRCWPKTASGWPHSAVSTSTGPSLLSGKPLRNTAGRKSASCRVPMRAAAGPPPAGSSSKTPSRWRRSAPTRACIDIGGTLIGMHLRRVAVPVRLSLSKIGEANILCARTRPKLIGGERAKYTEED